MTVVELGQNVLGPAPEALHLSPDQALGEVLRQRETEIRAALVECDDPPRHEARGEPTHDGLDLGQLGHAGAIPAARGPLVAPSAVP